MIDEFQDIDFIQYELMKVLCDYHKNLFIVGDPDQTIYTWRGANVNYLLDFDKNFPDVQTIMMMQNYRSTPQILNVANSLIAKNKVRIKKDLIPTRQDAEVSIYNHAKSAVEEAEFIADEVLSLIEKGRAPGDIVVLYRAHYISRNIEEVFQKKKIPYTLFSGLPFFDRLEIKDSLAYLRMIAYKDDLDFLRVVNSPKRNIGERRIKFLKEYVAANGGTLYEALKTTVDDEIFNNTKAKDFIKLIDEYSANYSNMQISEVFSHVMNDSGYEKALRTEGSQERLDNLAELKQSIYEYETSCGEECSLQNYLAHAALYTNADLGTTKNCIRFMTVHSAKGLEFPVVFVAGLNENMFPSKKVDSQANMEEERRLAFVAFTRAMDLLYLTEAEGTTQGFGFRFPSRFIFDVNKRFLQYKVELPEHLIKNAKRYIDDSELMLSKLAVLSSLAEGDRVSHGVLGKGTVVAVDETKHVYSVQFDNLPTPRKMSFKAPLKKEEADS